jgi:hypothetical protein
MEKKIGIEVVIKTRFLPGIPLLDKRSGLPDENLGCGWVGSGAVG